jgi:hypothetical protein
VGRDLRQEGLARHRPGNRKAAGASRCWCNVPAVDRPIYARTTEVVCCLAVSLVPAETTGLIELIGKIDRHACIGPIEYRRDRQRRHGKEIGCTLFDCEERGVGIGTDVTVAAAAATAITQCLAAGGLARCCRQRVKLWRLL